MFEKKFNEKDEKNVIDFLNFIAKKAKFDGISVQDTIEFFRLLSCMQKEVLPKLKANILEIKEVVEAKSSPEDNK